MSLNRSLAGLIDTSGDVKSSSLDNVPPSGLDSAQVTAIASGVGLSVYSTLNDLPSSGLASGDQAYVSSTSRFYISNGSGWYNVALINATPNLAIDPTGAITLAVDGVTPTVITLTATDSDDPIAALTYSVESDGNFGNIATLTQDSSVFTITPLSEDSATPATSTLTFKASDGISFGSVTSSLTLTFSVANTRYTRLLIKSDNTELDNQVDASSNTHTITETGNVTSTPFTPYHPGGYSTYFDGTGDYLSSTDAEFYLDENDNGASSAPSNFTFNFFTNLTDLSQQYRSFFSRYGASWSYNFYWDNTNTRFVFNINSSGSTNNLDLIFNYATGLVTNKWYHISFRREGTGSNSSTYKLYLDGTQIGGDQTDDGKINRNGSSSPFRIGMAAGGSEQLLYPITGYIRDFELKKGAQGVYLPFSESTASPLKSLTVSANTELLTCHRPYIADGSSNNHALTVNGNTSTKRYGPYDYIGYTKANHGGSVYFDGTGDNLSLNGHSDFNMGSNFTLECWCYCTAIPSGDNDLLMLVWDGSSNNSVWVSYTSANKFEFRISYVGGWAMTLTSAGTFPINQWYHVAATRNSGTAYLYINGVQEATGSNSTDISSTGNVVNIGSQGSGRHFNGYIADARIINGTAVYTSAFTPPTAPLTAIANTKLLTCTNKNDMWDTASANSFINAGNYKPSNTQRKWSTSSAFYFDGNSSYIKFTPDDSLKLYPNDDFTVEGWVWLNSLSDTAQMFCMFAPPHWNMAMSLNRSGYGNTWVLMGNGSTWNPVPDIDTGNNFQLSAGQWHHVALVKNGNTITIYHDGNQAGQTTNTFATTTGNLVLGAYELSGSYGEYLKGYLQDFRITHGLARYTANFTPPTAEFEG